MFNLKLVFEHAKQYLFISRDSVEKSVKEVSDHLEELINDIKMSTARYEGSPLIKTKTEESDEEIPPRIGLSQKLAVQLPVNL